MKKKTKTVKKRLASIAIIGIGRVGLPFAIFLANEGYKTFGIGRDHEKIEEIKNGKMPFMENGAEDLLRKTVNKNFIPTVDYKVISECKYIILTLGTPIDENMNPVLTQIENALKSASAYFKKGQTLILRSTVSPKTTEFVKDILNKVPGIEVGSNFFLAFCPERIAEGYAIDEIRSLPQIIGGVDKKSSSSADLLFRQLGIETVITDSVSAELAKLFTNMYRYINFAIANEFMIIAGNYYRDIYEIINMVNNNYKRGGVALPGLTSGPCLFKDGFFLISDLPFIDLISTSWKINESIPLVLVQKIRERMSIKNKKAVILGLSFKGDIDDIRESLSFKVHKALLREGAQVDLHDPYVKEYANQPVPKDVYESVKNADLIFICSPHSEYKKLNINKIKSLVRKNCMICDIWNVFKTDSIIFSLNKLEKKMILANASNS